MMRARCRFSSLGSRGKVLLLLPLESLDELFSWLRLAAVNALLIF